MAEEKLDNLLTLVKAVQSDVNTLKADQSQNKKELADLGRRLEQCRTGSFRSDVSEHRTDESQLWGTTERRPDSRTNSQWRVPESQQVRFLGHLGPEGSPTSASPNASE